MIKSMTGYGKSVATIPGRRLIIEIKSLNSKLLDLTVKSPVWLREKELAVRTRLANQLERGKIDVFITTEITGEEISSTINHTLALHYQKQLRELLTRLNEDYPDGLLPLILKMPDIFQNDHTGVTEEDWNIILEALDLALDGVDQFRIREGHMLELEMAEHTGRILQLLESITPLEEHRVSAMKENLQKALDRLAGNDQVSGGMDRNRFEQELIYYLEKMDFTEEKTRLKQHISYFSETLGSPVSQGKKLSFITQEMGREINTLGSKANDAGIQMIVVQMKDELEKIKEQLANIL